MEISTHHAKKTLLEMPHGYALAFYANAMSDHNGNGKPQSFGSIVDHAIEVTGLKKKSVAKEAGIHATSLSRIIAGEGVARDTAIAVIRAINRMAGREVVNEVEGLKTAGYAIEGAPPPKPQTVAEFVQRLSAMGFDIQLSAEYENLGPDELQDLIDQIEANILIKSRRTKR